MTDLDKLIDAVERGAFLADVLPRHREMVAYRAFSGSLDAAKALHDALLPGFNFVISGNDAEIWRTGEYLDTISGGDYLDDPARAWLIAILKAYRAQQDETK